jgi:DNA-binding response OmpR family regulator
VPAIVPGRQEVLSAGPLQVLPAEHLALVDGRPLTLSVRAIRLLTELARRADRIMTREELYSLVWGREMRRGDRSVDVYVRKLRVKLDEAVPDWRFIHTHFGFGYRLSAEQLPGPQPFHNSITPGVSGASRLHPRQMKEMTT